MAAAISSAANLSGKWKFLIELDPVGWGEPTFFFEQSGQSLTGRYVGPLGERPVTGSVDGEQTQFTFVYDRAGKPVKAIYSGKVIGPDKMSGKLRFDGFFGTGVWTAVRSR
jgi:hypothetical protein